MDRWIISVIVIFLLIASFFGGYFLNKPPVSISNLKNEELQNQISLLQQQNELLEQDNNALKNQNLALNNTLRVIQNESYYLKEDIASKGEKIDCLRKDGRWHDYIDMTYPSEKLDDPYCVLPFSDNRKACNDSSQCEGACEYYRIAQREEILYSVYGVCSKFNVRGSCFIANKEVINGVVNGSKPICVN